MRIILRILSALILTVAAAIAVVTLLPGQKLAQLAAQQIERQTGREIRFDGEVRFTIWPTIGLRANDVTLANAPWAGPEPLLVAGRLNIGLDARDLLRGEIRVTELSAIVPQLSLETREDGTGNWVLEPIVPDASGGTSEPEVPEVTPAFAVEALRISGGSFRYAAYGEDPVEMRQVDLELLWPDPEGAAQFDLTLRPSGTAVSLTGEIGPLAGFLAGQEASVGVTMRSAGARARFDGRATLEGALQGRITGDIPDVDAVLAALGQAPLLLPRGMGQGAILGADLTFTPDGRMSFRDLSADLQGNRLTGAADVKLADPVQVKADLTAGVLDLTALDAAGEEERSRSAATPGQSKTVGWSKAPIDASALGGMEGVISLQAEGIKTTTANFGTSALTLRVERARAVLSLSPVAVFGGTLGGDLIANNRNGLSVAADLSFNDIALQPALTRLADFEGLTGTALGEIKLLGVGNSLHDILASLQGNGWLEVGSGRFTGFDLHALMNPAGGDGGTTIFDALSASYVIEAGTLRTDDFLATLPLISAEGAGDIGVSGQNMDMLFTPTAFAGADGGGISVPLRVHGPWNDLNYTPDLSKLEELQALEDQAKDAVRNALSEELEAPVETLEEAEDALRQRIEDQAREQLLKFLGQN